MQEKLFDLGLRLQAQATQQPQRRIVGSTVSTAYASQQVIVRSYSKKGTIHADVQVDGNAMRSATGENILHVLADEGVSMFSLTSPGTYPQLITDSRRTVQHLHDLAVTAKHPDVLDVAAVIAFWFDRLDFPGTQAIVNVVERATTTYVTGEAPTYDRHVTTWCHWFTIANTATSAQQIREFLPWLTAGPFLHALQAAVDDDVRAWNEATTMAKKAPSSKKYLRTGIDGWRRPDSNTEAAVGLKRRNAAAELWNDALLTDPLWRARQLWSGHVTEGTVTAISPAGKLSNGYVTISSSRLGNRLRAGKNVHMWAGPATTIPVATISASVEQSTVNNDQQLELTFTVHGRNYDTWNVGDVVTVVESFMFPLESVPSEMN